MVAAEWIRCRAWLVPVMVDTTEAEVVADLTANRATLWPGDNAAMVTQLIAPSCCHIWLAGGLMDDLLAMRAGLEAWARAQGCAELTINGRRGWARVLQRYGYTPAGEELRKALA